MVLIVIKPKKDTHGGVQRKNQKYGKRGKGDETKNAIVNLAVSIGEHAPAYLSYGVVDFLTA